MRFAVSLVFLALAGCSSEPGPATPDGSTDGTLDGKTSDAQAVDAGDAGDAGADGDGSCIGTFGDASCWSCARDPSLLLAWNASCGADPALGYLVEWGAADAGAYPNVLDAGDPCEAGAGYPECLDAGAPTCTYDLTSLEAGSSLCVVTLAYDDAGNTSAPSNPTCAALPPRCP